MYSYTADMVKEWVGERYIYNYTNEYTNQSIRNKTNLKKNTCVARLIVWQQSEEKQNFKGAKTIRKNVKEVN